LFYNCLIIFFLEELKIIEGDHLNPCRPVETKKAEPKAPSAILKGACIYSNPCKDVNIIAKIIVISVPSIAALLLPPIKA
jgi:hypothetical protein